MPNVPIQNHSASSQEAPGPDSDQFVRFCLRGHRSPQAREEAQNMVEAGLISWPAVKEICEANGLAPLFYQRTWSTGILPPELSNNFRPEYLESVWRSAQFNHEVKEQLLNLEKAGIQAVVLKGMALIGLVYKNPALRPMNDLDLLVKKEDLPAASLILSQAGYIEGSPEPPFGSIVDENERGFIKPGPVNIHIELHWSLFSAPHFHKPGELDWFWQGLLPVDVDGTPYRMLSIEAQLLHLCSHLFLHHGGEGLLWFNDIAELIDITRDQIDWDEVISRACSYDMLIPLKNALVQIDSDWQVQIPAHILETLRDCKPSLRERRKYSRLTMKNVSPAYHFFVEFMSLPTWRDRLRYTRINVFPPSTYMMAHYHFSSPWLLPFYYLFRWFYKGLRRQ